MNNGYIRLSRSLMQHWVYGNKNQFFFWVDMLLYASYEDNVIIFEGKPVNVKRGEIVGSTRFLAHRWKVCKQTAQEFLKLIEQKEMISRRRDGKFTIYKIVNYDEYQSGNRTLSKRTVGQKSGQTKEEEKNLINISLPSREKDLEFFNSMLVDDSFFSRLSTFTGLDVETLKSLAKEYFAYYDLKGKFHKDQTDYKDHFINWLNGKIEREGAAPQNSSKNAAAQNKYAARRSTPVNADAEDGRDDADF